MNHAAAPYFSLIVPVYKVERFLQDALDSVHEQTFTDYEALCVDDGSPDGSGTILDEAARVNPRFRVIHQRNAGVSAARNRALDLVRGKYILFLDADDVVCPEWFHSFARVIQSYHPDQVRFTGRRFPENEDWRMFKEPIFQNSACHVAENELDAARILWPETAIPDGVVRMAWRTECLRESRCRFPIGLVVSEDFIFHLDINPYLRRVVALDYLGTYWRERSGSAVMTPRPGSVRTLTHLCVLKTIFRLLKRLHGDVRRPFAAFYLTSYAWQAMLLRPLRAALHLDASAEPAIARNPRLEVYADRLACGARGGLALVVALRIALLYAIYVLQLGRYHLYKTLGR